MYDTYMVALRGIFAFLNGNMKIGFSNLALRVNCVPETKCVRCNICTVSLINVGFFCSTKSKRLLSVVNCPGLHVET